MTPEIWKTKYGSAKQPVLVLSDEAGEANLIGQMTTHEREESQLDEYKTFRLENLKKTRPDFNLLIEGVTEVNGKKVGFFKFSTQAVDTNIYS